MSENVDLLAALFSKKKCTDSVFIGSLAHSTKHGFHNSLEPDHFFLKKSGNVKCVRFEILLAERPRAAQNTDPISALSQRSLFLNSRRWQVASQLYKESRGGIPISLKRVEVASHISEESASGIPISPKRVEVASHISRGSASSIPISPKKVEVASPSLFRRWRWHPHLFSEGGGGIPISPKKVKVAPPSVLRRCWWHPHLT